MHFISSKPQSKKYHRCNIYQDICATNNLNKIKGRTVHRYTRGYKFNSSLVPLASFYSVYALLYDVVPPRHKGTKPKPRGRNRNPTNTMTAKTGDIDSPKVTRRKTLLLEILQKVNTPTRGKEDPPKYRKSDDPDKGGGGNSCTEPKRVSGNARTRTQVTRPERFDHPEGAHRQD